MVQTLEVIDGGGSSIRVGTTGTICSLMTRELESMKDPHGPIPHRKKLQTIPVSVPCGGTTPKKSQSRRNSPKEASSSDSNHRSHRNTQETKHNLRKNEHQIPMLSSNSVNTVRNPNKEKQDKKGSYIVEVVDINCGASNTDKPWSSPITSRLKKLGFSKLSETVV